MRIHWQCIMMLPYLLPDRWVFFYHAWCGSSDFGCFIVYNSICVSFVYLLVNCFHCFFAKGIYSKCDIFASSIKQYCNVIIQCHILLFDVQFVQNSLYAFDCKITFMTAISQPMMPNRPHSVNCLIPDITDTLMPNLAPLGRDKHEQQS